MGGKKFIHAYVSWPPCCTAKKKKKKKKKKNETASLHAAHDLIWPLYPPSLCLVLISLWPIQQRPSHLWTFVFAAPRQNCSFPRLSCVCLFGTQVLTQSHHQTSPSFNVIISLCLMCYCLSFSTRSKFHDSINFIFSIQGCFLGDQSNAKSS